MLAEILVILALIVLNGALAMSELAVVSARPARLKAMGTRGARSALRLAEEPGRFLSTVQIGITAVGILSGALAGDTLGERLAGWLVGQGMSASLAGTLGVGGVVVAITYVSLIVGELVPKQLALRNPERLAAKVAPTMAMLSRVAAPVVWLLDRSGALLLRLLGVKGTEESRVTEEEVKVLLAEAEEGGVLEGEERVMMAGVMRLSDRTASALMTPRHQVAMLALDTPPERLMAEIQRIARPRMPLIDADGDVVGLLRMVDVFQAFSRGEVPDPRALMQPLPVVLDRMDALDLVEVLVNARDHMAMVQDEYGHFEGLVTTADVLRAILGSGLVVDGDEASIITRADGSLLVAGAMPADEFCDRLGLSRSLAGDYDTVAGLMLHQLGHLAATGEWFEREGHRFEVIDMDGMRIDKVLVSRLGPALGDLSENPGADS